MSIDTDRERTNGGRQRPGTVERLTPAAKSVQARPGSAQNLSAESVDQSPRIGSSTPGGPNAKIGDPTRGRAVFPAWLGRLRYYGLALLFVGGAAVLRWALADVLNPTPTLVFYLAWVGAAAFGGLGPGLLATAASWLCIELLFDFTPGHIGFSDPLSIARLLIFLAGGLVVSVVGEAMRHSRIRERRHMEKLAGAHAALREREEKYRFLVENAQDVTWTVDLQGRWTFVSGNVEKVTGYRADEFIGKTLWDFLAPECHDLVREKLRRRAQGDDLPPYEVLMVDKEGRRMPFELLATAIVDDGGKIVGVQGVSRDITERKRAEEALRESEFHLAQAQQIAHLGSWSWDLAAGRLFWSDETYRLYGLQPGESAPRHEDFLGFVHPEDRPRVQQCVREALAQGGSCRLDFRIVQRGGQERYVHCESQVAFDAQGHPVKAEGALQDITERKRAEEALKSNLAVLAKSQEIGHLGSWTLDFDTGEFEASDEDYRIYGLEPQSVVLLDHIWPMIHPDDLDRYRQYVEAVRQEGRLGGIDYRIVWSDGSVHHVHALTDSVVRGPDGRVKMASGITQDITERKQAEEAVAESRKKYRGLVEKINDWVWEIDADGVYTYASPRALELLGYPPEEIVGKTPFDLMPPAEAERVWNAFQPIWLARKPLELLENTLVRKDGRLVTVETSGMPVFAEDGAFRGYTGVDRDVTERKRAEEALRASQSMLQSVMDNVPQGIFWKDRHSTYLGCNHVFAKAAGLESAADIVGKTDDDLPWSPEQTASFREYDRLTMENDAPQYHIIERQREADGKLLWVETNKVPLHDAQGRVIGMLGTYSDITERKKYEEALREWNATLESKVAQRTEELKHRAGQLQKLTLELTEAEERERKRLAEILHDDLQQVLAAAKFHVSLLSSRVKNDAESQELAEQTRDLLGDAIAKSRRLSHELSAPGLSRSDLSEAFEWLAEQVQTKHGLTVHLDLGGRIELASEPLRVLLYKAAQELLFNASKHAGVHEAKLRLRRRRGRLRLLVSDTGRGFDPMEPGGNLGFGLLSIRERVEYLGGRMKIRSAAGKGSIFIITVPDTEVSR